MVASGAGKGVRSGGKGAASSENARKARSGSNSKPKANKDIEAVLEANSLTPKKMGRKNSGRSAFILSSKDKKNSFDNVLITNADHWRDGAPHEDRTPGHSRSSSSSDPIAGKGGEGMDTFAAPAKAKRKPGLRVSTGASAGGNSAKNGAGARKPTTSSSAAARKRTSGAASTTKAGGAAGSRKTGTAAAKKKKKGQAGTLKRSLSDEMEELQREIDSLSSHGFHLGVPRNEQGEVPVSPKAVGVRDAVMPSNDLRALVDEVDYDRLMEGHYRVMKLRKDHVEPGKTKLHSMFRDARRQSLTVSSLTLAGVMSAPSPIPENGYGGRRKEDWDPLQLTKYMDGKGGLPNLDRGAKGASTEGQSGKEGEAGASSEEPTDEKAASKDKKGARESSQLGKSSKSGKTKGGFFRRLFS